MSDKIYIKSIGFNLSNKFTQVHHDTDFSIIRVINLISWLYNYFQILSIILYHQNLVLN